MSKTTIKRQYNNDVFIIDTFYITVQFNGFTPDGKYRYRVGMIDTANKHYNHEIVFTTTSHENASSEAARVLEYYREKIKA